MREKDVCDASVLGGFHYINDTADGAEFSGKGEFSNE